MSPAEVVLERATGNSVRSKILSFGCLVLADCYCWEGRGRGGGGRGRGGLERHQHLNIGGLLVHITTPKDSQVGKLCLNT